MCLVGRGIRWKEMEIEASQCGGGRVLESEERG